MDSFAFHIPTKIIFGCNKLALINNYIAPEITNILIVTDQSSYNLSGAKPILEQALKDKSVIAFTEVEENPSYDSIKKASALAIEHQAQIIIGLGGGSAMDTAKGTAILAANKKEMQDYMSGIEFECDPLPIICIPTTSGTGSEVTPYAVFSDYSSHDKAGFAHDKIFPQLALIDPTLTYSMPESILINTGCDVLTHAVEAYLSTESFKLCDSLALHCIEQVIENLPAAASNKSHEAMDAMAYASMVAGICITHGGTILLHIMGYPLTSFYNIPHGLANAILLPTFLNFIKKESWVTDKTDRLEQLFVPVGGIEKFMNDLNISCKLTDYGIKQADLGVFAKKTIVKSDVLITPAKITEQVIYDLYLSAL